MIQDTNLAEAPEKGPKSRKLRPGTEKRYGEFIKTLTNELERRNKAVSVENMIDMYCERSPNLSYGYWLVATAAIRNLVESQTEVSIIDAIDRISKADRPSQWRHRSTGIDPNARYVLESHLQEGRSRSNYDMLLYSLLRAGVLTGLRPAEWSGASIVDRDGQNWLRVKNAKVTGSDPLYRHLGIYKLPKEEVEVILALQDSAHQIGEKDWDTTVKIASRLFRLTCAQLKLPSDLRLYATRHQFAANAKSKLSEKAVSALMGHWATGTTKNYASETYSEIDKNWRIEAHVVTELPDFLLEEEDKVVDSKTLGGRSGRGTFRPSRNPS